MDAEALSAIVVDTAFRLHRDLGPGLLESVYETVLARQLARQGLSIERQKAVAFDYEGLHFDDGLRVDMLIERRLVVELKSTSQGAAVHAKQVLTYLRLLDLPLGLLINFGAPMFKEGITRVVNGHTAVGTSRLRINRRDRA
jgi:iron complex transport system substrate-binding protein